MYVCTQFFPVFDSFISIFDFLKRLSIFILIGRILLSQQRVHSIVRKLTRSVNMRWTRAGTKRSALQFYPPGRQYLLFLSRSL